MNAPIFFMNMISPLQKIITILVLIRPSLIISTVLTTSTTPKPQNPKTP